MLKIIKMTEDEYRGLTTKERHAIYILDNGMFFIDGKVYGNNIKTVSSFPSSPLLNVLYINTVTNEKKMYTESGWINVDDIERLVNMIEDKVDKIEGKGLSTNDFSNDLKTKLDNIAEEATKIESSTTNGNIVNNGSEQQVYTHPENHSASMIIEDTTHRFVTDEEKNSWNEKITSEQLEEVAKKVNDMSQSMKQSDWNETDSDSAAFIKNKPDLNQMSVKYATNSGDSATTNGHSVNADVPAGAKFTDTTYGVASQSTNGLMSAADKIKLDKIDTSSVGNLVTRFNSDGSITQTGTNYAKTTRFNANGSITETTTKNGVTSTITTVFNADGSISEIVG